MSVKIKIALDEYNNYIDVSNSISKTKYRCIDCKEELIPKKGNIKAHHFAHLNKFDCNGESWQHIYCKRKIAELYDRFQYNFNCECCDKSHSYIFQKEFEPKIECNITGSNYIADIGLIKSNTNIEYCFEIFHTHKTSLSKQEFYAINNIKCIEISTQEIFSKVFELESDINKNYNSKQDLDQLNKIIKISCLSQNVCAECGYIRDLVNFKKVLMGTYLPKLIESKSNILSITQDNLLYQNIIKDLQSKILLEQTKYISGTYIFGLLIKYFNNIIDCKINSDIIKELDQINIYLDKNIIDNPPNILIDPQIKINYLDEILLDLELNFDSILSSGLFFDVSKSTIFINIKCLYSINTGNILVKSLPKHSFYLEYIYNKNKIILNKNYLESQFFDKVSEGHLKLFLKPKYPIQIKILDFTNEFITYSGYSTNLECAYKFKNKCKELGGQFCSDKLIWYIPSIYPSANFKIYFNKIKSLIYNSFCDDNDQSINQWIHSGGIFILNIDQPDKFLGLIHLLELKISSETKNIISKLAGLNEETSFDSNIFKFISKKYNFNTEFIISLSNILKKFRFMELYKKYGFEYKKIY